MKKIAVLISYLLIALNIIAGNIPSCPLIPSPQYCEETPDVFELNEKTRVIHDEDLTDIAHYFQNELFRHKGLRIPLYKESGINNQSTAIVLRLSPSGINKKIKGADSEEAYSIKMNKNEIIVEATHERGIFNGATSLLQLIRLSESKNKTVSLNCYHIEDAPLYEWRGVMLDESRHFFGKEKVKQLLDWMAFYKLNRFHWHLSDDTGWRIEIKKYPLLTFIGGIGNNSNPDAAPQYYTQEEIKEIVQYAAERNIEVIPEIDMPGHARAANRAYSQFSGGGSEKHPDFTFNPGLEGTYQYLTDILKEVDILFPSQMIHLGGDEVHFGNQQWEEMEGVQRLMSEHNLTDLAQVEKHFMVRMADSLYAMGNKLLAWDEMADISLPTDQSIIFWWRHDKPDYLTKALDKNYQVVLCPRIPFYFDFVQHDTHKVGRRWAGAFSDLHGVYSFNPEQLAKEKSSQVLGIQANLWTELVKTPQRFDFMIYPRISALSEAAWGTNNRYEDYQERLKNHLTLYQESRLYFFNPFNIEEQTEPSR